MTKTIEELQAQRIKELDESRNYLYARIDALENKLQVATDECVWFANKNKQLNADKDKLEEKLHEIEYKNDELKASIKAQNRILSSRLDTYIDLANFWYKSSLQDDKEEIRKIDNIYAQRYEHMAEAIYNILYTAQDAEKFVKLFKRYNPDL